MTEAIIFDMDGLMFDTETISIPSWVKAGEILGYPITEAMIFELFGMNPVAVNAYWKEHFGDDFDCGAAMKLHLDYMEHCMVFEDSLAGIEAAWRAGMKPVMVPDKVPADSVTEERLYAKLKTLDEGIGLLKKES